MNKKAEVELRDVTNQGETVTIMKENKIQKDKEQLANNNNLKKNWK